VAIVACSLILVKAGDAQPWQDGASTMLCVIAMILMVKAYMEQWVLWIVVDVVTVIMWAVNFSKGGENIATLAMWSVYLINAIIMFVRWYKEAKKNEV
jgi:nicotinamide mononucleotide transporter